MDPLDYCWSGLNLNNATLTLTNGVAIGIYGTRGTCLLSAAQFVSQGTPNTLNRLVRYPAVQEQSIAWGATGSGKSLLNLTTNAPSAQVNLRFTDLSLLAGDTTVFDYAGYYSVNSFVMRDSQIRGGSISFGTYYTSAGQTAFGLTNNLAQRATISLSRDHPSSSEIKLAVYVHNNLFQFGSATFHNPTNDAAYELKDNLFDTVSLSGGSFGQGQTNQVVNSNNGYFNTSQFQGAGYNQTLTTADYQTGPLGAFYYPTNGASGGLTNLINAGSRTADLAGLYHYTTSIGLTKETNSIVDIGYHYVATDANGNPLDFDGDGIPDYLEDYNGNGVFDSGETDWKTYNSPNRLGANGLQVFTPLK
jgi:hypothetical protein